MDPIVKRVADEHNVDIGALLRAEAEARQDVGKFIEALKSRFPPADDNQIDVTVFGSIARLEVVHGSDCDYLILLKGTPHHDSIREFRSAMDDYREQEGYGAPGAQGVFGDFSTATDLIARIGLDTDTNTNTTRRILLLIESISVYDDDVRKDVRKLVIERYCDDYTPKARALDHRIYLPHFLQNDLVRYWRTVAVDFGAKQWRSLRRDWYLRYAKLVTSRKVLFAGSLMSLFLTYHVLDDMYRIKERERPEHDAETRKHLYDTLVRYLTEQFDKSAIARLLGFYDMGTDQSKAALATVLRCHSEFCELLGQRYNRERLTKLATNGVGTPRVEAVERIARDLELALEAVFFDDPAVNFMTRQFGLF